MSDPIRASLIKQRNSLIEFINQISSNGKRNAVSIVVKFEHKRFEDNTGSAILKMDSSETRSLVMDLEESIERQLVELRKRIEELDE